MADLERSAEEDMHPSEAKVSEAIEACRPLLTEEEYRFVVEYNGPHNEWGLAIETLADFLGDKDSVVSPSQIRLIEDAFTAMKLEPGSRTSYLRELMARNST